MAASQNNRGAGVLAALAPGGRYPGRLWQAATGLLLLASLAYFALRGPVRAAQRLVDFPTFYSATRAWISGENPYRDQRLRQIFAEAGGHAEGFVESLNVPVIFPLLTPLAVLPYPAAKWIVLTGNLLLVGLSLYYLAELSGLGWREPRTHIFVILSVALASFHTSLSQGQVTIAITFCLVFIMKLDIERRDRVAGVLLAVSGALKPQMVIAFGLYYLLRRRWEIVIPAFLTSTVLVALSVGRMEIAGVPWLQQLSDNLVSFTYGGSGDPTLGTNRYLMMNLHVVLHDFIESRAVVNVLVLAAGAGFFGALLTAVGPGRTNRDLLLIYSCLAAVTPLLAYSRFYTTTLLIFPLAWAFTSVQPRFVKIPFACLVSIAPFLLPGAAVLLRLSTGGPLTSVVDTWWWKYLLLPHQIYALLALVLLLTTATRFDGELRSTSSRLR